MDNNYHLSIHQDLMTLASKNRQFSKGAANYYHITKHSDKSHIERHYNKTVMPILKKHNFTDRFSDDMHNVQKEVLSNWRKEDIHHLLKEETPTNNVGSGNIAGIGVGPQGEPGGKGKTTILRRKKTLKQFMSGI